MPGNTFERIKVTLEERFFTKIFYARDIGNPPSKKLATR